MITFSCKNSVKNGNIHYIKYYSLLSQGDVKLAWNSSLYLLGILLTGNCYEPTYIIHVKQTLAVTNCFTRNKIVYLLQNREQKELEILIWMEDNRSIGNVINTTEIIPMNLKFKCQTVASFFCVTTINLSEYIELVEKG